MNSLIKLGFYTAAGIGTYEILRRTGLLQKAGHWLSDQVPDEYKEQARDYAHQVRERAGEFVDQARERAQDIGGQLRERARQTADAFRNDGSQGMSGAGGGLDIATDDANGGHARHKVGRGVVR